MRRPHLLALAYYALLIAAITFPLIIELDQRFIGDPFSDAYEYSHHIWWINHALRTGEPVFHLTGLAYPDGLNGAWLWGNPFQSFPAWVFLFVMPLPAAYNLGAWIHLTLNGWAAYFLGWHLTRHTPSALLAGTIFAIYPALQGHLIASHTGLTVLWGIPLYVLMLTRLRDSSSWRDWRLAVITFVLSVLGNSLLLVYALFPITAAFAFGRLVQRQWQALLRTVSSAVVGGLFALIFIAPIALEQLNTVSPASGGDITYSSDLLAFVAPSFYNPLFSDFTFSRTVLGGVQNVEGTAYMGLVAAGLAMIALVWVPAARGWGGMTLGAAVLALGPVLKFNGEIVRVTFDGLTSAVVLPWALLMNIPVLNIARTPGRFNFAVALGLAVLAGYGFHWLSKRIPRRWGQWALLGVMVPIIAFEYQVSWENGVPHQPTIPYLNADPITALRDDDRVRAVFNVPYAHALAAKDGMILQTRHQKPLIAGHVTRQTPVSQAKLATMERTFDPALLRSVGADVVILHQRWAPQDGKLEQQARAQLGEPFYADAFLAAWYVPAVNAVPAPITPHYSATPIRRWAQGYVYLPFDLWVQLYAEVNTDDDLELTVFENQTPVSDVVLGGDDPQTAIELAFPLRAGFHTIRLQADPTCPRTLDPALTCRRVVLDEMTLTPLPGALYPDPAALGAGIVLEHALLPQNPTDTLRVSLAWSFAEAISEQAVRFVHVIDASGRVIAQDDTPLGTLLARSVRYEQPVIPLTGVSAGTYTVRVGWYIHPDITPLGEPFTLGEITLAP